MNIDIRDSLRHFFWGYSEERRLPLYRALVEELVNIHQQTALVDNDDKLNALKHQLKGICRYLSLSLDEQINMMATLRQLHCLADNIHGQVAAIEDEL
ncbi:hypothetical protein [Moritella sp. JT01]|uniref:hypothetical protein n=1 Tax=Moritella sp. JT01 TaxID=756698 RepID=UPI0008354887|nr:hypothetical protein [Moritella sp. JT01]